MTDDEMAGWHHQLDGHELSKLWRLVIDREALHAVVFGVTRIWTQLSDCTELNMHACAHTHTHICIYIYISVFVYVYMYIHMHIYTYMVKNVTISDGKESACNAGALGLIPGWEDTW